MITLERGEGNVSQQAGLGVLGGGGWGVMCTLNLIDSDNYLGLALMANG